MTTTPETLTASGLCRVYATAGLPVLWRSDELLRFATLLDRQEQHCVDLLEQARQARRDTAHALLVIVCVSVFAVCLCAGIVVAGRVL